MDTARDSYGRSSLLGGTCVSSDRLERLVLFLIQTSLDPLGNSDVLLLHLVQLTEIESVTIHRSVKRNANSIMFFS